MSRNGFFLLDGCTVVLRAIICCLSTPFTQSFYKCDQRTDALHRTVGEKRRERTRTVFTAATTFIQTRFKKRFSTSARRGTILRPNQIRGSSREGGPHSGGRAAISIRVTDVVGTGPTALVERRPSGDASPTALKEKAITVGRHRPPESPSLTRAISRSKTARVGPRSPTTGGVVGSPKTRPNIMAPAGLTDATRPALGRLTKTPARKMEPQDRLTLLGELFSGPPRPKIRKDRPTDLGRAGDHAAIQPPKGPTRLTATPRVTGSKAKNPPARQCAPNSLDDDPRKSPPLTKAGTGAPWPLSEAPPPTEERPKLRAAPTAYIAPPDR